MYSNQIVIMVLLFATLVFARPSLNEKEDDEIIKLLSNDTKMENDIKAGGMSRFKEIIERKFMLFNLFIEKLCLNQGF